MNQVLFFIVKVARVLELKWNKLQRQFDKEMIKRTAAQFEEPLGVNRNASRVTKNTFLGKNVNFNGMKIIGKGKVEIGDNFHSGFGCMIMTDNHNYKTATKLPYDETIDSKDVFIGDNVWLGNNVTILPGTNIGEGVIVQNGSVVFGDIAPLSIIGGHPAKKFGERDAEHYTSLKEMEKFH